MIGFSPLATYTTAMAEVGQSSKSSLHNWPSFPSPFPASSYGNGFQMKTLRELEMMQLSASIRRKEDWFIKMKNPDILAKWQEEARRHGCTDNQVSFVFQELEFYASLRKAEIGAEVSDVDGVWHSDRLIPDSLRQELLEGVAMLEDIPEWKKDWHPGSNMQVLDLVHPSLYPLTYGVTRSMPFEKPPLKVSIPGMYKKKMGGQPIL